MPLALGIDIGTTNTKVALVEIDPAVRVRALAAAPTPEPAELKGALWGLVGRALDGAPPPEAVGIASMAETGVPLDAAGTALGPWLRWNDHQAGPAAEALSRRLGWAELVAATGVRPGAKVPLAMWAWLRAHRPDTWRAMASWAGAADLAAYLLTGRLATDHTLAGRTMAYRLPGPGEPPPDVFDAGLLAEVGLRPEQLPAVTSTAGRVAEGACGLRAGTPVVVAGHDHAVGAYACGVREPGDVADSVGTAEAVMSVVAGEPDPVPVGRAGMSVVVTVGGRHRAILAGSSSAGATVGWWLAHEAAGADPGELFARVLAAGDRPTGVIVLPYLSGRQAPEPDPGARLRVLGRERAHGPVEAAKAMLEGLCLQTRWMLAEQARLAGREAPPTVHLLGGAANPAWARIKAQALPGRLRVVPAAEPVAVGAALVAAGRTGCVGPPVPALESLEGPPATGAYDQMFARFVEAATRRREQP